MTPHRLALAILCACVAATGLYLSIRKTPTRVSSPPSILFVVTRSTFPNPSPSPSFLIEPLAYVQNGNLIPLPKDPDLEQFDSATYANHKTYTLFSAGNAAGQVRVLQNTFNPSCSGLGAEAEVNPPQTVSGSTMALASNGTFRPTGYTRRPATRDEIRMAMEIAPEKTTLHQTENLPSADVFQSKNHTILVANDTQKTPSGATFSTFWVAEKTGTGPYRPTLVWSHSGAGETMEIQQLIDILDLNNDGTPELLTRTTYQESEDYEIYQKINNIWVKTHTQPGPGC